MFFYIVFSATLFAGPAMRLPIMTATLLAMMAWGRIAPPGTAILSVYTSPLLAEFLAGAYLGSVFGLSLHKRPIGPTVLGALATVAALAALHVGLHSLLYGVGSVALVAAILLVERTGRLPRSRALLYLGNASYSIYLFQQIGFDVSTAVVTAIEARAGHGMIGNSETQLLAIGFAVGVGLLAYRFIEKPLTRIVRSSLAVITRRPKQAGLTGPAHQG